MNRIRYTGYNVLTNSSVSLFFLSWLLLCSTAQQIFLKLHWYLKRTYYQCEDMHIIHREFGFINISGSSAHFELRIRVKWICVTLQWSKLRVCHPSVCVTLSLSPFQVKWVCFFLPWSKMRLYHFLGVIWVSVTLPLRKMSLYHPSVCVSFSLQINWVCFYIHWSKMSLYHPSTGENEFLSPFHWVKWVCVTLPLREMHLYHPSIE